MSQPLYGSSPQVSCPQTENGQQTLGGVLHQCTIPMHTAPTLNIDPLDRVAIVGGPRSTFGSTPLSLLSMYSAYGAMEAMHNSSQSQTSGDKDTALYLPPTLSCGMKATPDNVAVLEKAGPVGVFRIFGSTAFEPASFSGTLCTRPNEGTNVLLGKTPSDRTLGHVQGTTLSLGSAPSNALTDNPPLNATVQGQSGQLFF